MSASTSLIDEAPLNRFHLLMTIYTGGGPFLDGYILSMIGTILVQATPALQMSDTWAGLIGASALIGVLIGGLVFGYITDLVGRQAMYVMDLSAIILLSLLQPFVTEAYQLFILHVLIGIAVGADYPIATSLLAEFLPKRYRGRLLSLLVVIWFVGATVAYLVGVLLLSLPNGWRWMLFTPAVPAAAIVLLRLGTPESPRWLVSKGRVSEALEVLQKLYGKQVTLADLPEEQRPTRFTRLFEEGYLVRTVYVAIFWTCAIVTLFAIYAFGPRILEAFRITGQAAAFGSALISLGFLVGCLIALLLVDRIGRRRIAIYSFLVSGIALLALALWPSGPIWFVATCFAVYAIFIGGAQILEWVYPNELFPTEVRATAVGFATAVTRIGSAIGTFLVPFALREIGIGATMLVAAVISFIGLISSLIWAPETKGLPLGLASQAGLRPHQEG